MSKSSDIFSIHSSKLNDEMLLSRRKNERIAIIIGIISQFIWALNSIQLKSYKPYFPSDFSINSLVFWRSLPIWLMGYFICKYKNIKIKSLNEIHHKFWFIMRSFGNYVGVYLWIKILGYFRVSTCQVVSGCYPILVIFLSIPIFHEKFYYRYILGVFICICGSTMIVLNERNPQASQIKLNDNRLEGLFFCMCHLTISGLSNLGQKMLCKEHLHGDEQNFYLGMYNTLPALLFCIIENHFGFGSIIYILYAISNGLVLFYSANYFQTKSLENLPVSKFMTLTYLCTVFVFLLGAIILHDKVFLTDILGAGIIIGFQLYDIYNPPGRKINIPNKINSNITPEPICSKNNLEEKFINDNKIKIDSECKN
jgi:drug/metabolite transporter (DMT)-like permease